MKLWGADTRETTVLMLEDLVVFVGPSQRRIFYDWARGGSGWILGVISFPKECGQVLAQLPRGAVGSPSLELSMECGDVALRNVLVGHGGVGWS